MKCPSCSEDVADDAAICPKCDAVLDASLFDNKPPEADGPTEPAARPLKAGVSAPGAKKPLPKRPAGGAPPPPRRSGPGPNTASRAAVKRPGGQGMPEAPIRK